MRATDRYRGPTCGHSACRQSFVDTGAAACIATCERTRGSDARRSCARCPDPSTACELESATHLERLAGERLRRRAAARVRLVAVILAALGMLAVCFWLGAAVGLSLWGRP